MLVPRTPGWDRVRQAFFDGDVFAETFPRLLEAFWLDMQDPAVVDAVHPRAVAADRARPQRRSPALFPLRAFAVIYTDVFRGIPVILLVYLIGFGVPALGLSRDLANPLIWGTVTLSCRTRPTPPRSSGPASSRYTRASERRLARSG